ncbi:hypothetical protein VP01_1472g8 [Puccinia sorghi]|uniref:DDE Tnp4 domain-containing protein n=1 Tax=Puccinia sorghi TaxID=27349 RepID=A0A0L6VJU5_9BASI|nr:hypothetical protein VP01_1472g8 [Puccinia sorghi]
MFVFLCEMSVKPQWIKVSISFLMWQFYLMIVGIMTTGMTKASVVNWIAMPRSTPYKTTKRDSVYLIAASGFPTKTTLVPAFKKPPHRPIPQLKEKFNQHLASLWVCNKHCIGILKGRFQSLCTCVVLHNFLLNDDSPLIDCNSNLNNPLVPRENNNLHGRGVNSSGNQHQEKVFQGVLRHLELA